MSLIYICERWGTDPFDYLVELQKHATELAEKPAAWMPWNYRETMEPIAKSQENLISMKFRN
jgi:hypothetical protein